MEDALECDSAFADEELRLDQRVDNRPTGVNITYVGRVVQVPNVVCGAADPHADA